LPGHSAGLEVPEPAFKACRRQGHRSARLGPAGAEVTAAGI